LSQDAPSHFSPDTTTTTVLGIDPGLRVTGWGLVATTGEGYRKVACGAIPTKQTAPDEARLHQIFAALCDIVRRWQPASVAVEDPFVGENTRSAFAIGEARAVALLAAAQAALPVQSYAPAAIKLAVTGYGRSDKAQVQELVRVQLHLDAPPEPIDAADALAVALCHHLTSRARARLASAQ
jgi:crossover junction endodeoxyribonuclease RuvC